MRMLRRYLVRQRIPTIPNLVRVSSRHASASAGSAPREAAVSSDSIKPAHREPRIENAGTKKDTYMKTYLRSLTRPEEFWDEAASKIVWHTKYQQVVDRSDPITAKWFVGGKLSVCYNALDRHCDDGHGDQVAFIHDSPVTKSVTSLTFNELLKQVTYFAGFLRSLGVKERHRIIIYMPMIPEAVVAMLACARIGAIHSVVFGGFSAKELSIRISHAKAYAVVCGSCGIERQRPVDYKEIVDDAIEMCSHKPKCTIVYQRPNLTTPHMKLGHDVDWNEGLAMGKSAGCVPVDANDPLYILYTSGTTGSPKAIVRPTGSAVVLHWTMNNVLGLNPEDVWWAASDFGWVVGHSFICYGPLLHRNTSVIYEGKPTGTPDAGSFFRLIEQHHIKSFFTAPTSLRSMAAEDPDVHSGHRYNLESLSHMFVAGEHCDSETKQWAHKAFGGVPVLDQWWQTETGWPMTSTCVGLGSPMDPPAQSSGHAVPGWDVRIVDTDSGKPLKPTELGRIVVKLPLPPGNFIGLWEDDGKYRETYFEKYPGYYDTMDAGTIDADGYVSVLSRMDDVINVSGCRISTSALEEAVLRHPEVVDCAVVGVKDKLKGQIPIGIVVLRKEPNRKSKDIISEIVTSVRDDIGPIAAFKKVCIVPKLPKTRSGKIPRSSIVQMAENKEVQIPSTIEDADVYPEIKKALQSIGYATEGKSDAT
ncbi:hypothetical protein RvY_05940 [Ramazzottius varieornatus]|uniref:Acyl-CoA synthetase short-chain family member 3, mitochondrial n=1 Tax=Ramazzottius varieornatus TaxID=947166 RepID=A0A1D1UZT4_RAMVA|nr:hypothetical protein RvY_05940 [Ramazzottius varieornatus]